MRKIIFLNEDVVDDYLKNRDKYEEREQLIGDRRKNYIRGGIFTGVGATLASTGVLAPFAIPFLVIGPRNLRTAGTLKPRLEVITHNLGKETLRKIKYFNNIVKGYPKLKEIYDKLMLEFKYRNDDAKIKKLADELRDAAREEGIDLEYISAEELSKKSK